MGVLIIVVSLPLAFFVKEAPPAGAENGLAGPSKTSGTAEVMSAFKTLPFFLLTLGSMCSIAAVRGTQQNLKLFLSLDQHFTQADAARVLSLVLSCSIVGRLLMGWLADRFSKKHVMLLTYLLVAAGIPFLFLGHTKATLYTSAATFGVGLGGDYMIIPLMTAEIFGMQVLGRLLGVILTAGGIAEAVAPWLTGRLRDATGNYSESCILLVVIALLGAAAVLGLPEPKKTGLQKTA
jgi:MFS family permease